MMETDHYLSKGYAAMQQAQSTPDVRGFFNKSLQRRTEDKYAHRAFPFGTSSFPFKPQRLGGSVNATTKSRAQAVRVPMGVAGVKQMYEDAKFTHKGTYAVDRFGQVNFHEPEHGSSSSGTGSVFDQIAEQKMDDLDRLIGKDCKNTMFFLQ